MRKKEKNAWVPETEIGFCIFKSSLKMDSVQTVSEYRVQLLKETFKSCYPLSIYNGTKKKQEWLNTTCPELSQSVSVDPLGMRSNEADCFAAHCWVGRTSVTRQWDSHMYQSRDTPVCSINGHQPPASLPTSVLVANHQSSQSQLLLLADTSPGLSDHYCPVSWNRVLLSWKFDLNT